MAKTHYVIGKALKTESQSKKMKGGTLMLILWMLLVFPILSSNSFYLSDIVYSPERGQEPARFEYCKVS